MAAHLTPSVTRSVQIDLGHLDHIDKCQTVVVSTYWTPEHVVHHLISGAAARYWRWPYADVSTIYIGL